MTNKFNQEIFQDFISINDYTPEQIAYMLDVAAYLKKQKRAGEPIHYLAGKTMGMIFQKSSTRTRVSFETGMYYLGGSALFLSSNDLQIGRGEPICDTGRTLARYLDGIMIRTYSHQDVIDLAKYSSKPVINALTDLLHPCQVMADLLTIKEYKGELKGLKLVFIGDGNNMANSLINGAAAAGMNVVIASPVGYKPDEENTVLAEKNAAITGATITIMEDPKEAIKDADVVYTDVWASMGQEGEQTTREKVFAGFQVNDELLALAKDDAIVLHCLPAKRGQEISAEVIEAHADEIFEEAENRLHAQMAVMALLMANPDQYDRLNADMAK